MKHTKGKATIGHLGNIVNIAKDGEEKKPLALVRNAGSQFNEQARINAQRIVLTFNSHDEILEALENLVNAIEVTIVDSRLDHLAEAGKKVINNIKS